MSDSSVLPRITSRFVRGELAMQLQGAAQMGWVDRIAMPVMSDQSKEDYAWLGNVPQMREWKGGRQSRKLREFEYSITNKKYEATIDIPLDWVRRDKTGLVQRRISDLARRNAAHWRSLLTTIIANGHAGTYGLCYDGQFYFDTDHAEGDSGTQDNDLTLDIGTANAPTAAEMETAIKTIVQTMVGYKDDAGELINEDMTSLLIMVPPNMLGAATAAIGLPVIVDGSASRTALLPNWGNFTFEVAANARLTATDVFFAFRSDVNDGLVRQEEYGPDITDKAEGSDYEHDTDAWQFGIKASRNVGFGFWQRACRMAFT